MGFFSRLTFLGRFIIIGIIVGAIGCFLYFSGLTQAGAKSTAPQESVQTISE